jgi:hypothetical protein
VLPSRDAQGAVRDEISVDAPLGAPVQNRLVRNESGALQELALLPDELFEPRVLAENITAARHI